MGVEADFRGTPRFEVLSRLGAGSSGVVYQAFDREHEREVALKALRSRDAVAVQRFREEFASCRDLAHPNLVRFEEMFEADGQWFFTMELVRGVDLMSYLRPTNVRGERAFDETRGRTVMRQLAESLSALHQAGRVHRDVKPANVRVTSQGRAVLLDLGLATEIVALASEAGGAAVGTPQYCAPEQALGAEPGPAADWYSFGAVLFEALTGRAAFEGSIQHVLEAKVAGEAPDPYAYGPHGPPDLLALCRSLLSRDPARRPDGRDVLTALGASTVALHDRVSRVPAQARELALLRDALLRAHGSALLHVSVTGAEGAGKSSLLSAFAALAAREHGAVVLHSRCYPELAQPFEPLLAAAKVLATTWLKLEPAQRRAIEPGPLGLMLPPLCAIECVAQAARIAGPASVVAQRAGGFNALRSLLCDVARAHPLLWLIDDGECLDEDSLRGLQGVLRDAEAQGMLLVTARSTPGTAFAAEHIEHVTLSPDLAVSSIGARREQLSADARQLVGALCVVGHPVTTELLSEVVGQRGAAFSQALASAQQSGLVRELFGSDGRRVEAVHRWLCDGLPESERKELCARWAVAMHGQHGMPEATLAQQGELPSQAGDAALKLAQQAKQQLAFVLEARMLTLALDVQSPAPPAVAHRTNVEIGEAWSRAGHPAEGAHRFLAAALLAKGAEVLSLRRRAAELLMQAGQINESVKVLDELLRSVDVKPMSTAGWSLASIAWHRAVLSVRGYGYKPRAVEAIAPSQLIEVDVGWSVGQIASTAKTLQGLDVQTRSLRRALAIGEPHRVARALATETAFLAGTEAPPHPRAHAALLSAREVSERAGDPALDAACDVSEAMLLVFSADFRRARVAAQTAATKLQRLSQHYSWELASAQTFYLFAACAMDPIASTWASYRSFLEQAKGCGDRFAEVMLTTGLRGHLGAQRGDLEAARSEIEGVFGPWRDTELHFLHVYRMLAIADLDLYAGDRKVAERIDELWPEIARGGLLRMPPLRPLLARVRGASLLTAGQGGSARATAALVRREAKAAAAVKHGGGQGVACVLEAGACVLLGHDEEAMHALERADEAFAPTGMESWRQAAQYQLGRLKGGDEGKAIRDSAEAAMRARGIADPARFAETYATGCAR